VRSAQVVPHIERLCNETFTRHGFVAPPEIAGPKRQLKRDADKRCHDLIALNDAKASKLKTKTKRRPLLHDATIMCMVRCHKARDAFKHVVRMQVILDNHRHQQTQWDVVILQWSSQGKVLQSDKGGRQYIS